MKMVVISVATGVLADFVTVERRFRQEHPGLLTLQLLYAAQTGAEDRLPAVTSTVREADLVLVDLMGASAGLSKAVYAGLECCQGTIIPIGNGGREYLRMGALQAGDFGMKDRQAERGENRGRAMDAGSMQKMMDMAEKMGKVIPFGKPRDMKNWVQVNKYWKNAGEEEIRNLLYLLLRDYGGCKTLPKPADAQELVDLCIRDPRTGKVFPEYSEYRQEFEVVSERPVVAVLYYGHNYPNRTSDCVAEIIEALRSAAAVLPVAFTQVSGNNLNLLGKILCEAAGKKVNLVINLMSFRLGAGPMGGDAEAAVALLRQLNVPVLHPFFMSRRSEEEWRQSAQGATSSEFLISVMLPELDGCIGTYPIGAMESRGIAADFDLELHALAVIAERRDKLVAQVRRWLTLQQKPNRAKKVAILCYNYPPGEDNLFGGAFLDTFRSVEKLLSVLDEAGYAVEKQSAAQLMEHFTTGGICNSGRWSDPAANHRWIRGNSADYAHTLRQKPYWAEMKEQWGNPPGEIMADGEGFLIPGLQAGNIFIGLQPTRGVHENPEKSYHDKSMLPHHQYIAFYQWIRETFAADVIVHVGTHGTLEFLPGKECGMSGDCFPDQLIGEIPHVYFYYMGNPAEAMIAKRRSHAVLVSYQPPAFMEGGLYGEITALAALVDEFHESLRSSPAKSPEVIRQIQQAAGQLHLPQDLDELEGELYRMKRSLIPSGLHVLGEGYSEEEAFRFMSFVLRYDRGELKAVRRILAEDRGLDYDELLERPEPVLFDELDAAAEAVIRDYLRCGSVPSLRKPECRREMAGTLDYGGKLLGEARNNLEMEGFLRTLDGGYQPARLAGDLIRNPEVLPAGLNLYQFDPRFVPTQAAYQRGARIAENTLRLYQAEHGTYPLSTAVILWGLETSRTQGETVGQILAYLGIAVTKGKNVWEPKYEIIPLHQLGRPRVDVVINICGFFRDMFPNLIDDLNAVLERLAEADEPAEMNHYQANCARIYSLLLREGYEPGEARELSRSRIFGPAEAQYGTGITKLIETRNWETEEQIGETFIRSLKHVYSKSFRGRAVEGLLDGNLKAVDVVSQIRSNHEYEVTDLDHYYEFFGGLAKSVEMAKGERCEIYISDSTGERMETESVEKSIRRGVQTRLLNPRWIDKMLEHPYHGVQKIGERFVNMVGLAATTNRVENWVFSSLHARYISDPDLRKRMEENNRWAYLRIVERLLECHSRGYWQASAEELDELRSVYLALEGQIEETMEDGDQKRR